MSTAAETPQVEKENVESGETKTGGAASEALMAIDETKGGKKGSKKGKSGSNDAESSEASDELKNALATTISNLQEKKNEDERVLSEPPAPNSCIPRQGSIHPAAIVNLIE